MTATSRQRGRVRVDIGGILRRRRAGVQRGWTHQRAGVLGCRPMNHRTVFLMVALAAACSKRQADQAKERPAGLPPSAAAPPAPPPAPPAAPAAAAAPADDEVVAAAPDPRASISGTITL